MNSGRTKALIAVLLGLLAGLAYPIVDLAIACRIPDSEACVWGKAYLPLTFSLSIMLVGGVVAAVVFVALSMRNRKKQEHLGSE